VADQTDLFQAGGELHTSPLDAQSTVSDGAKSENDVEGAHTETNEGVLAVTSVFRQEQKGDSSRNGTNVQGRQQAEKERPLGVHLVINQNVSSHGFFFFLTCQVVLAGIFIYCSAMKAGIH
jgi:hypothetical protein